MQVTRGHVFHLTTPNSVLTFVPHPPKKEKEECVCLPLFSYIRVITLVWKALLLGEA